MGHLVHELTVRELQTAGVTITYDIQTYSFVNLSWLKFIIEALPLLYQGPSESSTLLGFEYLRCRLYWLWQGQYSGCSDVVIAKKATDCATASFLI